MRYGMMEQVNYQNKYAINSHNENKNDVFDLTEIFPRNLRLSVFKYLQILKYLALKLCIHETQSHNDVFLAP